MRIRLAVVLVSCVLPTFAECAAPFVAKRKAPVGGASNEIDRLLVTSTKADPARSQFAGPLALPILEAGPKSLWVPPYEAPHYGQDPSSGNWESYPQGLDAVPILARPEVHTVSLPSRSVTLSLDIAGVDRWGTALVELWITLDGWTWHRYHRASSCDSLAVAFPGEGRYGLRIVVHDLKGHPSPTPRASETPHLWVEVDEGSSSLGHPVHWFFNGRSESRVGWMFKDTLAPDRRLGDPQSEPKYTRHFAHWEIDQPAYVKQMKQEGLHHPCGYIKRMETESPEWDDLGLEHRSGFSGLPVQHFPRHLLPCGLR